MAKQTDTRLRGDVIYSIYVRNHTPEGTFAALEQDLDRIKALGADILWLLPIHPIGQKNRKGRLGSPYAIRDYRAVNPELGTREDFVHLVEEIHRRDMKCIIDVVYNHTSPDSVLAAEHPEWFYRRPDGSMGNKTADWTDVVDLDYRHRALWDYQIATLVDWAAIVDGFRCDVASLVPVDFWLEARQAVEAVRPGVIWLAESVEPAFIRENRWRGFAAHSDSEVYTAFDICYDYDILEEFHSCAGGTLSFGEYARSILRQDTTYPANYVKLRYLENHDQPRAASLFRDPAVLRNWTAFAYLLKGTALVYGGQEFGCGDTPSLFEKDVFPRDTGTDLSLLLHSLYKVKHTPLPVDGNFSLDWDSKVPVAVIHYEKDGDLLEIVCSLGGGPATVSTMLADGSYANALDGCEVRVQGGAVRTSGEPIVLTGRSRQ